MSATQTFIGFHFDVVNECTIGARNVIIGTKLDLLRHYVWNIIYIVNIQQM
jgi:hypothetical protein